MKRLVPLGSASLASLALMAPGRPAGPQRGPSRWTVNNKEHVMNNIIWIVGAVVIVMVILGFLGLS